jgi:predicted short-subunit dehydrogenase-like oxidoreductase (DUF2520 family)
MTTPKLVITVIGDTEVGRGFAAALSAAGHSVLSAGDRVERIGESDLVLLAVSGSALTELISSFTERDLWRPGQLVAHTAGEFGYSVLAPAVACGVIPLAIHPSMRFTDSGADEVAIRESYFAVSAPEAALPIAQALVIEMGAEPLTIAEADRKTYFEAWSVANDFSGLVVNQAIGLLQDIGITDPRGVIGPVVRASVEQALADGHRDFDELNDLGGTGGQS